MVSPAEYFGPGIEYNSRLLREYIVAGNLVRSRFFPGIQKVDDSVDALKPVEDLRAALHPGMSMRTLMLGTLSTLNTQRYGGLGFSSEPVFSLGLILERVDKRHQVTHPLSVGANEAAVGILQSLQLDEGLPFDKTEIVTIIGHRRSRSELRDKLFQLRVQRARVNLDVRLSDAVNRNKQRRATALSLGIALPSRTRR